MSRPRVVLLIGATSGIGRATAHALATRSDVLVLAARDAGVLDEVVLECQDLAARTGKRVGRRTRDRTDERTGARVLAVPVDVSRRDSVEHLFAQTTAQVGRVDAVVHAPAVVAYGRFEEIPAEVFDHVIDVNLRGTADVARLALQRFTADGGGHLVLVGSLLGRVPGPWMSPYVVSKWAVHGLASTLRAEARSLPGVTVSLLVPGSVDTPIYTSAASYAGRVGRPPPPVDSPERVAAAVVRLLDRPRPEVSVGWANPVWTALARWTPQVYEALAGPVMSRVALSRTRVAAHPGNVFTPVGGHQGVHGQWGRHWWRGVGLAVAAGAVWGARRVRRAGTTPRR